MNKLANFIIDKRYVVLGFMLLLTVVFGVLSTQVDINTDMSKYLPDSSPMKQGIDIMEAEFPAADTAYTIRVMFRGLSDTQTEDIQTQLEQIQYVKSVSYDPKSPDYNKDGYTLFVVNTGFDFVSAEGKSIEEAIHNGFSEYDVKLKNDDTLSGIPTWLVALALTIMIIVLLIMCKSWLEPFVLLLAIGVAVALNMGTNIFLGSVSNITFSIASILQLVLSMNYSIILMNRYRQELKVCSLSLPYCPDSYCFLTRRLGKRKKRKFIFR